MKWEYMMIDYNRKMVTNKIDEISEKNYKVHSKDDFLIKKLDEFGESGWEVVSILGSHISDCQMILKRPK